MHMTLSGKRLHHIRICATTAALLFRAGWLTMTINLDIFAPAEQKAAGKFADLSTTIGNVESSSFLRQS